MRLLLAIAFAALLALPAPGMAVTLVVRPDGSGDFPTIQAAMDGAASGDSIMATAGTYRGPGNRDVDFRGKAVVLFGQDGAPATIIDCEGTAADPHRAFVFASGETESSVLAGLTIRSGHAGSTGTAGAISCIDSSPTIKDCVFADHFAEYGGAIGYLRGGGAIIDCAFERSRCVQSGGAIYCVLARLVVAGCEFRMCSAGSGGALFSSGSSVEVTSCSFSLCQAATLGGALCATAEGDLGSGAPGRPAGPGFVAVADCSFDYCSASLGGGVQLAGVSGRIARSVFTRCFATYGGGVEHDLGEVAISRCTFWNCSGQIGACVTSGAAGAAAVENSILAFSSQGAGAACFGGTINLACCDVFGNAGGDWVGCIAGQQGTNGNLAADPLFCDAAAGDFSLQVSSPCAPGNSGSCGLIGALDVGCGATAVEATTWGQLKARFAR